MCDIYFKHRRRGGVIVGHDGDGSEGILQRNEDMVDGGAHLNFISFFSRLDIGESFFNYSRMNWRLKLTYPRAVRTSFPDVGVFQYRTGLDFLESIDTPWAEITKPLNSVLAMWHSHFSDLQKSATYWNVVRMEWTLWFCSSPMLQFRGMPQGTIQMSGPV